jgi:hypothetical protein
VTSQPDSAETIHRLLSRHYAEHGLPPDGGESAKWFRVKLGPFVVPVPNFPARRRAVFLHDINHVLTDYDTRFSKGEMEIAGFEVGAGCGGYVAAWSLNLFMMLLGLIIGPRRVIRAFKRGRRSRSLYRLGWPRERLLSASRSELRAELGIDL